MSVEPHSHCQATVISANGTGTENGSSWMTIKSLKDSFSHLPTNWINEFKSNHSNITQDFATVLKLMNGTANKLNTTINTVHEQIDSTISGLNSRISEVDNDVANVDQRLTVVEGQIGQLNKDDVVCYIAPKKDYFSSRGSIFDPYSEVVKDVDGVTNKTLYYYTRKDESSLEYSYCYSSDEKLYAGDDSNLELQYKYFGTENQKKYPLFTLNQAMKFLRRFRANGAIKYKVVTQFGEYDYGSSAQIIQVLDAKAGSSLVISPNLTERQMKTLPCYTNRDFCTSNAYSDDGVVKVKFLINDNINKYATWSKIMEFNSSTTVVDGCGIIFNHVRTDTEYKNVGRTYGVLVIAGGHITFQNCVLRNVYMSPNTPESPPEVAFLGKEICTQPTKSADYTLDNLYKYSLPCVFVDDEMVIDGTRYPITTRCINGTVGDRLFVDFYGAYVVFRTRRSQPLIGINSTCTFKLRWTWNKLGKFVICLDDNYPPPSTERFFYVGPASSISYAQSQFGSDVTANCREKQFRIDIIGTTQPEWLTNAKSIFSNQTPNYDPATGTTNVLLPCLGIGSTYINVNWNGTPLPR